MMYYILNKTHIVNNLLVDEPIGYLTNMDNALLINYKYETTYLLWVNNNKTDLENGSLQINNYFNSIDAVYDCNTETTEIDGMGLSEITDITPYI